MYLHMIHNGSTKYEKIILQEEKERSNHICTFSILSEDSKLSFHHKSGRRDWTKIY